MKLTNGNVGRAAHLSKSTTEASMIRGLPNRSAGYRFDEHFQNRPDGAVVVTWHCEWGDIVWRAGREKVEPRKLLRDTQRARLGECQNALSAHFATEIVDHHDEPMLVVRSQISKGQ